jgi:hypothetical protein
MHTINTATVRVTSPWFNGNLCLDCAAAIGGTRRDLRPDEHAPCTSCEEMARDADADAIRAEEEAEANDAETARQYAEMERKWNEEFRHWYERHQSK